VRFVIYGAGAIGGVIGARLAMSGEDVTFVARGENGAVLRKRGIELVTPEDSVVVEVPTVETPEQVDWDPDHVAILAMKSNDTADALAALVECAPAIRVVCAQNGVENERLALRLFPHVYSVHVNLPATHLEPGQVMQHSSPIPGMLDVGRYPDGVDATASALAEAFQGAGFSAEARGDLSRWKYRKLLLNLSNAVIALCGPGEDVRAIASLLRDEGEACLAAAGIDVATAEEDKARRGDLLTLKPVGGIDRLGGSSWQSLARGVGRIETDYLNGEIVLLGRLHGVPTPANELLQRLANEAARSRRPPGETSVTEILALLD
jgi:2-dehydropantoate 2-reductase